MKFDELPTTGRGECRLEVENGVIASVSISNDHHGCLTAWVFIDFRGGGCGFGGIKLGDSDGGNLGLKPGKQGDFAAEFLVRCINTVLGEWGKWEDLKGKPIRCLHEGLGGGIVAIGHFLKDEWFCPQIEFEG